MSKKNNSFETKETQAISTAFRPKVNRLSQPWIIALLLAGVTFAIYWPVRSFEFLNFDDPEYFSENPQVQAGLTWAGIKWAFTNTGFRMWHPLTWLSLMLDVELGKGAGGPHLMNACMHAINTGLLFALLRRMTTSLWRSALVAALFAWHPLRVESVAWVCERKDVLSAFFGFLCLWFYVRYAQDKERHRSSCPAYWLSFFFFACGLMSKPMLVTWPFVLLLLDYWPLNRFKPGISHSISDRQRFMNLLREKLAFLFLAVLFSILTFVLCQRTGDIVSNEIFSPSERISNSLVAYVSYLSKTAWPIDLAVLYPLPGHWSHARVGGSALLLAVLCGAALRVRQRWPFCFVGWFFFLGTLVPVIGLIQSGSQYFADRYTYLPTIGLFMLLAWAAGELSSKGRLLQSVTVIFMVAVLAGCVLRTSNQLAYWRNSETLFRHTLAVTKNNFTAHINLGFYLCQQGQYHEATENYQQAVRLAPGAAFIHNNLGNSLRLEGKFDAAVAEFREALRLNPEHPGALRNLGAALMVQGNADEAIATFTKLHQLKPDDTSVGYLMALALKQANRMDEAITYCRATIHAQPDSPEAHQLLGELLVRTGDKSDAVTAWHTAARLKSGWLPPLNSLAWLRATDKVATLRNGAEALKLALQAAQITARQSPEVLDTLAAAYAENEHWPEALQTIEDAVTLATASGKPSLAAELAIRRESYRAGNPWRE